jgi:hypothetical protein
MRRTFATLLLLTVCCAACTAPEGSATPVPQIVNGVVAPVRLLESWLPQEDTLTRQDAVRAWRFNGQQRDAITLNLEAKGGADVLLTLQDSKGNSLAQGSALNFTLSENGVYTALVALRTGDSATYRLVLGYSDRPAPTLTASLTPTSSSTPTPSLTPTATHTFTPSPTYTPSHTLTPSVTPTPVYAALGTLNGQLEVGEQVVGTYLSQFERHIYLFSGAAEQQVTISMGGMSGTVDPVLTLFDPTGQALASDDNSGGDRSALLRDIHLPVTGEYVIQAIGGGTGGYTLRLQAEAPPPSDDQPSATPTPPMGTVTPVAAAAQLADHVLALGMMQPGAFDRYFLDVAAGSIITLGVRPIPGSQLLPRVEIYTPTGEMMFLTTLVNGEALIPSLPIPETGRYAVFVNDDGSLGGGYTIAYGLGTTLIDNLRGSLAAETPAAGSGLLNVRDRWTLALVAGDQIAVEALGAGLEVVAPDGDVSAGLGEIQFTAARSGEYQLYVSGGFYNLTWRYVVAAPTLPPALLILSADDALPAQAYLTYPFQAKAGQRVHIRVEALADGLDPVAELLDPAGVSVASGDDSANSLDPDFDALLPVDGTYWLRINDYSGTGGAVNVTIEMLS